MTWNMNVYRAHTQKVILITHINGLKRRKEQLSFSTSMSKIFNQLNR